MARILSKINTFSKFRIAQKYFIHLILTDGGILDLAQTQTELVKSSELPLSIIIIGIGRDDFSSWEKYFQVKKKCI